MENQADIHLALLGKKVKDKVTGVKGVVTSMSFDLYGCVQAIVVPTTKDNTVANGSWFDVTRLTVTSKNPVMDIPNFNQGYIAEGRKGPADKPLP